MAETNLFCIIFSMSLNDERVLNAGLIKWKKRVRLVRNNIITKLIYKITILIQTPAFILQKDRDKMGPAQCCQALADQTAVKEEYQPNNIHFPSPNYAVKLQSSSELPFEIEQLRNMQKIGQIPPPEWYNQKQTFYIDQVFLLLGFGVYYIGEWLKGVPHGYAEIFTQQGEYFKGYLRQGIVDSPKCLFVFSPHKYYIGAVRKNKKNGNGKFVDQLYSYEGTWLNNLPHGLKCVQKFPNGDTFVGSFKAGQKQEGIYTWNQGQFQSYEGYFKDNQMYGKGQLTLRNKCIWSGLFDCSKNIFEIKNAVCKFQDKIFEGNIQDLRPIEGNNIQIYHQQLFGKKSPFKGKIFEGKLLVHCDREFKNRLRDILTKIQLGYQNCSKHSQALTIISKALPEYRLEFWKQGETIQGVAIVPICGRFIKITKRS